MEFILFICLALLGGAAQGVQAPVNAALGKSIGVFDATFVSFLVGIILLFFFVLFLGKHNPVTAIQASWQAPKWQLLGGILGAFYVAMTVVVTPRLGVAATFTAVVCGQILLAAIIDHFGLFGATPIPFNGYRMIGIACVAVGLFFVYKSKVPS